jgi:hypothetical protein
LAQFGLPDGFNLPLTTPDLSLTLAAFE